MEKVIKINGSNLTIEDVIAVARYNAKVELDESQKKEVILCREFVENAIKNGQAIYGINTGFGKFSDVAISDEELDLLQKNLIYSDACGVGEPFETEVVRAMMLLRAKTL